MGAGLSPLKVAVTADNLAAPGGGISKNHIHIVGAVVLIAKRIQKK